MKKPRLKRGSHQVALRKAHGATRHKDIASGASCRSASRRTAGISGRIRGYPSPGIREFAPCASGQSPDAHATRLAWPRFGLRGASIWSGPALQRANFSPAPCDGNGLDPHPVLVLAGSDYSAAPLCATQVGECLVGENACRECRSFLDRRRRIDGHHSQSSPKAIPQFQ
jgi:hypothetical protein